MNAQISSQLYDLFLRFNRRLVSITRRLGPELTLAESHVMGEICQRRLVTPGELIQNINLEKSKVSRILAAFETHNWVKAENSPTDRRVRYQRPTALGVRVFEKDSQIRTEQVSECIAPLNAREQGDLGHYLRIIADGFETTQVNGEPGDHRVKIELRRLTRAMGYMNNDFLGNGLPVEECQILHLTYCADGAIGITQLRERLPYEFSALSRMISRLEMRSLLQKNAAAADRRHVEVSLTEKGRKKAEANIAHGGGRVLDALVSQDEHAINGLIAILEKFLVDDRVLKISAPRDGYEFVTLKNDRERRSGRAFLIETIVRTNMQHEASEMMLGAKSICTALLLNGAMIGVAEVQRRQPLWTLRNCVLAPEHSSADLMFKLIHGTLERAFDHRGIDEILVKDLWIQTLLDGLKIGTRDDRGRLILRPADIDKLPMGTTSRLTA